MSDETIDIQTRLERLFDGRIPESLERFFAGEPVTEWEAEDCLGDLRTKAGELHKQSVAIRERRELLDSRLAKYRREFAEHEQKLAHRSLMEMNWPMEKAASLYATRLMIQSFADDHAAITAELDARDAALSVAGSHLRVLESVGKVIAGKGEPTAAIADAVGVEPSALVPAHITAARERRQIVADIAAVELEKKRVAESAAFGAEMAARAAAEERRDLELLAYAQTIPDSDVGALIHRLFAQGHAQFSGDWTGARGVENATVALEYLRKMRGQEASRERAYLRDRLHELCYQALRGAVGNGRTDWRTSAVLRLEEQERQGKAA